ncbi:condensation domain-containing protein [Fibrobacter sp.]|uniref:condensation domain-containing protein n=1 Tax=Fibrobacter sp. TaxID=35828 RepID=UPI0038665962
MDIPHLINEFSSRGVTLWLDEGKLKFRAANGALSAEDKECLKANKAGIVAHLEKIAAEESSAFPLSPIQKSYLVGRDPVYDLGGINTHYYMELEIDETIDIPRLENAWNEVIAYDDALRLVISAKGTQRVLDAAPKYSIEIVELENAEQRLKKRKEWSHNIYPLNQWPFFTMRVSRVPNSKDVLHFDFDCMIMDAWSAKIALSQMFKLYCGETVQWIDYGFKDYCSDLIKFDSQQDYSQAEAFWKSKINELVCEPDLPYAKPLSEIHNHRFSRISGELSVEEFALFQQRCREYRTTPAAVISTAYLKALLGFSKNDSLTINSTIFNRLPLHKDINSVVGDFTNIAFITLSKKCKNFLECVQSVQKDMWQLVRFHTYDGTKILKFKEGLSPMRAQMPIVITCVLENGQKSNSEMPTGMHQIYALSKTPQVVLDYQVTNFDGRLSVNWDYAEPAFAPETLKEMFASNVGLLKRLLTEKWDEVL